MDIETQLRAQSIEIAAEGHAGWGNTMTCAAEEIETLRAESERLRTLARDAAVAWDADRDARVGKLLRAMVDVDYCRTYRPDLVPNADIQRAP